jgi:hypothetical protein
MTVKAISPKRKLAEILQKLDAVREKREELYEEYLAALDTDEEDVIRCKFHPLDELLARYFWQAWQAYKNLESWQMDRDLSSDELEKINVYNGFDKKRRIVYCDGEIHFVLTDSERKPGKVKYTYGYFCNCE